MIANSQSWRICAAPSLVADTDALGIERGRPAAGLLLRVVFLIGTWPLWASAAPPNYTAKLLTTDIIAINAAAMNEAEDVVGTGTTGSGAWVSLAGAPATLLPLPPGAQYAFANDISDTGVIVGSVGPSSYPGLFGKAAIWD